MVETIKVAILNWFGHIARIMYLAGRQSSAIQKKRRLRLRWLYSILKDL